MNKHDSIIEVNQDGTIKNTKYTVNITDLNETGNEEQIQKLLNSILAERDYTTIDLYSKIKSYNEGQLTVGDLFKYIPVKFKLGNNIYSSKLYVYYMPYELQPYYILKFEQTIKNPQTPEEVDILKPTRPFLFYESFTREVIIKILDNILLPSNAVEINNLTGKFDGNFRLVDNLKRLKGEL